ncbi:DciA family protein [Streptomyces tricolor]|uniref:DciA family protein n=1 Tax=Streptomyces tricolor TaxID=68277 RepID=UPI0036EDD84A
MREAITKLFAGVWDILPGTPRPIAEWRKQVGPDLAQHVEALSFDAVTGTLTVRADTVAWAVNMRLLAPAVITRLNEALGVDGIRCLKILGPSPLAGTPVRRGPAIVAPELHEAVERQRGTAHRARHERYYSGRNPPLPQSGAACEQAAGVRARALAKARETAARRSPTGGEAVR